MMLATITKIPYAGSTSWAANDIVATRLGVHPQVAWEFRHDNREKWKKICDEFRTNDQTILMRLALAGVNEDKSSGLISGWRGIVVGARDRVELFAAIKEELFDAILWIENPRVPVDSTVTFTREDVVSAGGDVIFNDAGLVHLNSKLFLWAEARGLVPELYLSPVTSDTFRE